MMYLKFSIFVISFVILMSSQVNAKSAILEETSPFGLNRKVYDDVIFAGAAEGKLFWAVMENVGLNWTDAGAGCVRRNMKFAEITSPAQARVIQNSQSQLPCCSYWTAGRDSGDLRQFSWNSTNEDVSKSNVSFAGDVRINGCLYFRADVARLHFNACDDPYRTRAYLCEMAIPVK